MFQENRYSLLAPFTSDSVGYVNDSSKRSRISYTRNFLLSLAKVGGDRTLQLQREICLKMACVFENSLGHLPSPYCDHDDSVCEEEKCQDSVLKAPDNVNFLHKSDEPYRPPCRNKALSSSSGDSNGSLNGNISGSSECTSQEQAEPVIADVQIQQESELKSSNIMSLEDGSTCIPDLILWPDEDSLITYDGPLWGPGVEIPDELDSLMSAPDERNETEDYFDGDLDLDDPTFAMIKNLVESVLDGDDDDYPDDYYDNDSDSDFKYDDSLMDDIMAKLVQHGARRAHMYLSTPQSYSNQLNPGRDQQDHNSFLRSSTDPAVYSLLSHHCPCHKIYDHSELRRVGVGAGESMFQQGKMQSQLPAFDKVASCKEKLSLMQNWFEYQGRSYVNSVNGHPDSHGDGNIGQAEVDKFADFRASKFLGGFY